MKHFAVSRPARLHNMFGAASRGCRLVIATLMIAACAPSVSPTVDGQQSQQPTTPPLASAFPLLAGRAPTPTELDAHGLNYSEGVDDFHIGKGTASIAANDWNTIVGATVVPPEIGSEVDPVFHPSDTTFRRFQYLANRLLEANSASSSPLDDFTPIGLERAADKAGNLVVIAALFNPNDIGYRVVDISARIGVPDDTNIVATGIFFRGLNPPLIIPKKTVYFTILTFSKFGSFKPSNLTDFDLHYDGVYCDSKAC